MANLAICMHTPTTMRIPIFYCPTVGKKLSTHLFIIIIIICF